MRFAGGHQHRRQIETIRLPVLDRVIRFQHLAMPDHLVDRAEPEFRHDTTSFFGDHEQVIDNVLRFAGELFTQLGILRRDAYRASVQVALPHHDAAQGDERGGAKTKFFGAQQRGDHNVAPGFESAVGLQHHAATKIIEHQHLVRFGDSKLPRQTGMLDTRQG